MAGSTEYRTPPAVFRQLSQEFGGFTLDAAASDANALVRPHLGNCQYSEAYEAGRFCTWCETTIGRYYTREDNALIQSWARERVWCNPPYSPATLLYGFVEKAYWSARLEGALVVMLLNATCTDARWYHRFCYDWKLQRPRESVEIRQPPGRISFLDETGKAMTSPRHGNMFVIFHPWTGPELPP